MHLIPILHLSNYEILRGTSERYCYFEGEFDRANLQTSRIHRNVRKKYHNIGFILKGF